MKHKTIKSPLRWAGSKRWLVPALQEIIGQTNVTTLVDVFGGSGVVSYNFPNLRVWYADSCEFLTGFFKAARSENPLVIGEQEPSEEWYHALRSAFNQRTEITPEVCKQFYLLNRFSANGLCRFNKSGQFNAPYGKRPTAPYLRQVSPPPFAVAKMSWEESIGRFSNSNTVMYCDPPYAYPGGKSVGMYSNGWSYGDTLDLVEQLSKVPGPAIVSYAMVPDLVTRASRLNYSCFVLDSPQRINFKGDRKPVHELLLLHNIDAAAAKAVLVKHDRLSKIVYRYLAF